MLAHGPCCTSIVHLNPLELQSSSFVLTEAHSNLVCFEFEAFVTELQSTEMCSHMQTENRSELRLVVLEYFCLSISSRFFLSTRCEAI